MAGNNFTRCWNCGKRLIPKGANFCYNCGESPHKQQFNSSLVAIDGGQVSGQRSAARPGKLKVGALTFTEAAITSGLAVGAVVIWPYYPQVTFGLSLPLVAYVAPRLLPSVSGSFVEVWSELRKPREQAQEVKPPEAWVLQVEHIDQHGRPRLLHDFPEGIELDHLIWIDAQLGKGRTYSRRNMVRSGKLSQTQYEDITAHLLRYRLAVKKYPQADNSPIVLRESAKIVFKAAKTAKNGVVVGGGWGTGSGFGALAMVGEGGQNA